MWHVIIIILNSNNNSIGPPNENYNIYLILKIYEFILSIYCDKNSLIVYGINYGHSLPIEFYYQCYTTKCFDCVLHVTKFQDLLRISGFGDFEVQPVDWFTHG